LSFTLVGQFKDWLLAQLKCLKLRRPAGLPEIDIVLPSGCAQLVKPRFIHNPADRSWPEPARLSAPDAWLLPDLRLHASYSLRRRFLIPLPTVSATSAGNPFGSDAAAWSTAAGTCARSSRQKSPLWALR
jgi:hypothetical protein